MVALTRSATSLQRRMRPDGIVCTMPAAVVVPRGTRGRDGRPAPPRPENLAAFRRWYSDAEVARLTRYRDGPMRPDEIERFFTARVLGIDSLALAVHLRAKDRLIGSCAFSQLDGDNGSALFHITIGEKDAWGHGYGTEATRLMLAHAFTNMGLHRVGLAVFAFNERAIRSYEKVGFVVEGRAREAIYRDGRYWDEIDMSVLESEWRATQGLDGRGTVAGARPRAGRRRPRHRAPAGADGERGSGGGEARAAFRATLEEKGHAVENVAAGGRGPRARPSRPARSCGRRCSTRCSPTSMVALEQDEGQRLGGKSAEAARFISRAISRELDNA